MVLTQLILADDNLLVREGLLSVLDDCPSVEVVSVCSSLPELFEAVDAHEPDVVLTDIRMPPDHTDEGIRAARRLHVDRPDVGVIVLSAHADPAYALALFANGTRSRGYLLKDRVADTGHLHAAICAVAAGGSFIDDDIIDGLVRSRNDPTQTLLTSLTPRESEVLAEMAAGRNNAAIADALCVSEHAVEKHTSSIFAKLGLTTCQEINRRVKAAVIFLAGRQDERVTAGV